MPDTLSALAALVASRINAPRWHYLQAPLTSTSWDGDAYSSTAKTLIDLSTVFGVPAGVKAVLMRIEVRDSASVNTNCVFFVSPTDTADDSALAASPRGLVNDYYAAEYGVCPCNANGDIYYRIIATGAATMDVYIQIWGYYL